MPGNQSPLFSNAWQKVVGQYPSSLTPQVGILSGACSALAPRLPREWSLLVTHVVDLGPMHPFLGAFFLPSSLPYSPVMRPVGCFLNTWLIIKSWSQGWLLGEFKLRYSQNRLNMLSLSNLNLCVCVCVCVCEDTIWKGNILQRVGTAPIQDFVLMSPVHPEQNPQ